jgi:hypothetical protein
LTLALCCGSAGAATIAVDVTNDEFVNGGFDDVGCSLRDAVQAANTNADYSFCDGDNGGGTGNDTIVLEGGKTYTLALHAVPENTNASGDLDISGGGTTTIRSAGPGLATIDADSSTAPGPPDDQRGRAIDILSGVGGVTLEAIRVTGGTDTAGGSGGGGIRSSAPLTLTDSEVSGNAVGLAGVAGAAAGHGGGGILIRDGSLTLTRSTVANNRVTANSASPLDSSRGGGITYESFSGDFNATNSTISGNVVDSAGNTGNTTYAGGIYWFGGLGGRTMNLNNVTVSNNSAIGGDAPTVYGGGIVLFESDGEASFTTLHGTILAGNNAPAQRDCGQVDSDDDWISAGDNVVGDTSGCGVIGGSNDLFNANPGLGTLSNYGGLTRTQNLNPGSPAIDHGGSCPQTDQRGLFRAPVAPCDAGAFELGATTSLPPPPEPEPGGGGGAVGDTAAPDTQITAGPKAKSTKRKANFSFTSTEPGSTFECKLDDAAFAGCSSPNELKVEKGKHKFEVRATDTSGNVDPTPATLAWKVKKKKKGGGA